MWEGVQDWSKISHLCYHSTASAWAAGGKDDTPPGSQLGLSWLSSRGFPSW